MRLWADNRLDKIFEETTACEDAQCAGLNVESASACHRMLMVFGLAIGIKICCGLKLK